MSERPATQPPHQAPAPPGPGVAPDRAALARDLVDVAYLRGDFVLSSGARSSVYFDKYLFETKPAILRQVATLLAERVPAGVDRLAGPALGAVALATAVSLETGLPFVIVRPAQKEHGTHRSIEGELHAGERVLVIEDVITTAAQAIRAAREVETAGGEVAGILGVLDREAGGPANIAAAGYRFDALFRLSELPVGDEA
jgi:orotate phosphoribosyltransferase